MKNWRTFVAVATGTACVCLASQFVQAGADANKKDSVPTGSTAIIDDCEVSGKVERRGDGVYAILTLASRSEEDTRVEFNYAASCLPGRATMSRMVILPTVEKHGAVSYIVEAGATVTKSILLKESPVTKKGAMADLWTLKVARGDQCKGRLGCAGSCGAGQEG